MQYDGYLSGPISFFKFILNGVTFYFFGESHNMRKIVPCVNRSVDIREYMQLFFDQIVREKKASFIDVYTEYGADWDKPERRTPIHLTTGLIYDCLDKEIHLDIRRVTPCSYKKRVRAIFLDIRKSKDGRKKRSTSNVVHYSALAETYEMRININYETFIENVKSLFSKAKEFFKNLLGYEKVDPLFLTEEETEIINEQFFPPSLQEAFDKDIEIVYENLVKKDLLQEDLETTLNGTYNQKMYNMISSDAETYTKIFRSGKNNVIYRQFKLLEEEEDFAGKSGKVLADHIRTYLLDTYSVRYEALASKRQRFRDLYEQTPRPYYQLWSVWLQFYQEAVVPLDSLKMDAYLLPQLFIRKKKNSASIKMIVTGSSHTDFYISFFQTVFPAMTFEKFHPIQIDQGNSGKVNGCIDLTDVSSSDQFSYSS